MTDPTVPICVDLDGTLTPIDTLHESLVDLCRRSPLAILSVPGWLVGGKAYFKQKIAARTQVDYSLLPIRQDLLDWLKAERANGSRLVLVTAANQQTADKVAAQVAIFDEVLASSATRNLSGEHKRSALVERFGEKGFDYVGNDVINVPVWKSARQAIVVGGAGITAKAASVAEVTHVFRPSEPKLRVWLKAIRVRQWVKNVLVFLPALLSHKITSQPVLGASMLAFLSFSLCASSVYVVNDLLDLSSDRRHPYKRLRPFASGALSARSGLIAAAGLLAASILTAVNVSLWFCGALATYYVITWAYSLRLKRRAIVDVLTLAGLYTLRVIAGAIATLIWPSFWLLAFSIFIFLSLGIVKRYAELHHARLAGKAGAHGRGYSGDDLPFLMSLGSSSGFCAVIVLAFYINSPDSQALYRHSEPLWLICPLILYWISRMWLLANRGQIDEDPVVFAIRDRNSLAVFVLIAVLVALSL